MSCSLARPGFGLDVDLALPLRGVAGLFGPSGAGKTTLLRLVAGLERPDAGRLVVAGETWDDPAAGVRLPPELRGVGYVFQEPRLFGHLDVRANLRYGASRRRGRRPEADFDGIVQLLGLEDLLERSPARLSGGEAQRVAIGRALLSAPRLLLMDEPLASLDAARKDEILPFLDRLHADVATPAIYVSHSIEEVCRLCDQLVVLDDGRVVADGDLQEVLLGLDSPELGAEAGAVVVGEVARYDADYELTHVTFGGGELRVPGRHGEPGRSIRLRIRASDVSLGLDLPAQTTILNVLPARIEAIDGASGPSRLVRLAVGDARLLARITRRSIEELGLAVGQAVHAQVKAVAVREP
ncbi:MAG: molybdenum ABC transporter ATP-binding protein [Woeseiaceae bacterium]|nr:molybdenum ABC transporter ATP-binding protein [Woeseiaceae bacterium]